MASPARLHELIRHVRPLYRALYRTVDEGLAGSGLTVMDRAVLERLHDGGKQTVPEVAQSLDLDRQPVQRVVDRLLKEDQVERLDNPRNRKSPLLRLTPRGEEAIRRVLEREAIEIRRVARQLDGEELEACLRIVEQVIKGFGG